MLDTSTSINHNIITQQNPNFIPNSSPLVQQPPPIQPPVLIQQSQIQQPVPDNQILTKEKVIRCDGVFIEKKGGYNVIKLREFPKPVPRIFIYFLEEGEVLIRVVSWYYNLYKL